MVDIVGNDTRVIPAGDGDPESEAASRLAAARTLLDHALAGRVNPDLAIDQARKLLNVAKGWRARIRRST